MARQFDLPHSQVTSWEKIHLDEGQDGFYFDKKVEEDLIAEVQRLRAENAYLKKLNTLVAERVRQEKKHK